MKQYAAAIADHDKAIQINPGNGRFYVYRDEVKAELGQHFEAITDYDAAIRINSYDIYAYVCRGSAKREIGGYPQGNEDFERGRQLAEEMGNGELQLSFLEAMMSGR